MKDGKFEVGDRVRVVNARPERMYFKNGDIGVIVAIDRDSVDVNFNLQKENCAFWSFCDELELVESVKRQPAKKSRVRAYKEDYIQWCTLAEMRCHQLECDLNKAVDEAVDLRAAGELAAKELVRLTDELNGKRADCLTQESLVKKYGELFNSLTVWWAIKKAARNVIKRAVRKAVLK